MVATKHAKRSGFQSVARPTQQLRDLKPVDGSLKVKGGAVVLMACASGKHFPEVKLSN